jgi:hypothetical protein
MSVEICLLVYPSGKVLKVAVVSPSSVNSLLSHIASWVHVERLTYSDSVED